MCFEFSVDWERELTRLLGAYDVLVPCAVVHELVNLSECENDHRKKKALAALKLIEKYPTIEEVTRAADDAILKIAQRMSTVVFTNDTELRKRLISHHIPVVFLRGKKRLALEQ